MTKPYSGNPGFVIALLLMSAMTFVATLCFPQLTGAQGNGFFYSLDFSGVLSPWGSRLAEWMLLLGIAAWMVFVNRRYNFISTLTTVHASVFMLLCAAVPWITDCLSQGAFLAAANLLILRYLYRASRAPHHRERSVTAMFLVGFVYSAGSLCQYAFAYMMPLAILSAVILKIVKWRETGALILGIFTTFSLMCLNLGHWPEFRWPAFSLPAVGGDLLQWFYFSLFVALIALVTVLLVMRNSFSLLTANIAVRKMWQAMLPLMLGLIPLMIADYADIIVYVPSLFMFAGFQAGYLDGFSHQKASVPLLLITTLLSVGFLTMILYV